ncbi:zinc finger MYM-type protein 1-like [Melanaphis sacchari]|uniref:zinc finger MYM-type protein 1-like n=1 Tax=Melanaphis sacchari TaxID=742174 RepID=UPI000DC14B99|nr:zinc finger MYM-type protein 1-like [Melanaphis sacchari]
MKKEYVGKECSDENYFQKYTIFNSYLQTKTLADVNNDLNEYHSLPVNKESLVECEFQKDTEINSCLQNKGEDLGTNVEENETVFTDKLKNFERLPASTAQTSSIVPSNLLQNCIDLEIRAEHLSIDPGILRNLKLSPEEKINIIQRGPCQPTEIDTNFPKSNGRRFLSKFYWNEFTNGERFNRDWLSYSILFDRVFCIYCMFFGKNSQKAWTYDGFHAWQRPKDISIHEKTTPHINATVTIKMKLLSMPVLPALIEKRKMQVEFNREIVHQLIEVTLYLGRHSLAFRGHREGFNENIRGNFKDLVILLSKWSPSLAIYLERLQSTGRNETNFLSWQRQNQLIDSVSTIINKSIKKEIIDTKYFSVSIDTTFDSSKREQLAFVVRYVSFSNKIPEIQERLIALKESSLTTGQRLFEIFKDICNERELNWKQHLIGQSYDGASNMRGEYEGLQALVLQQNPSAIYIWCYSHRLNLVVIQMASTSSNAVDTFGNLEFLYSFISSSKKRIAFFKKSQKKHYPNQNVHRLKRVETTRWMSYSSALNNVLLTYNAVIETLEYIVSEESRLDFKVGAKASEIFTESNCFMSDRADEFEFTQLVVNRSRTKKKQFDENSSDEPVVDPKLKFKIDTYFGTLDAAIMFIDRNELCNEYIQFANLYSDFEKVTKLPKNIYPFTSNINTSDIESNVEILTSDEELNNDQTQKDIMNTGSSLTLLQICYSAGLHSVFPTLFMALRIACTLPVCSVTTERTFSKLKIIKNRLRSTMKQDCLESLLIISCESDVPIDNDEVVDIFAKCSTVLSKKLIG